MDERRVRLLKINNITLILCAATLIVSIVLAFFDLFILSIISFGLLYIFLFTSDIYENVIAYKSGYWFNSRIGLFTGTFKGDRARRRALLSILGDIIMLMILIIGVMLYNLNK